MCIRDRPSSDYVIKLAEAKAVLSQAAAQYAGVDGGASTVTQASSLGAEDVVISHLINSLQLDIGIFVLETGALHKETRDLLARFKTSSRAPVTVYQIGEVNTGGGAFFGGPVSAGGDVNAGADSGHTQIPKE